MRVPPEATPLQDAEQAFHHLLTDARDELDARAYLVFLDFACTVLAREVARIERWTLDGGDAA